MTEISKQAKPEIQVAGNGTRHPIADSGLGRVSKPKSIHLKRASYIDMDLMREVESIPADEIEAAFKKYAERGGCPNSAQKFERCLAKKTFEEKVNCYRSAIKNNADYSPARLFFIRQLACLVYAGEEGLRTDQSAFTTGKLLKMADLPTGTILANKEEEKIARNEAVNKLLSLRKKVLE